MFLYQKHNKRYRAFALIAILVFIALISLIALEFSKRSGVGLKLASNYADSKRALYYAYGGYQAALALLQGDMNGYDGPKDIWYSQIPPIPFDRGVIAIKIEDEKARFNLKQLVADQGAVWVAHERKRAMTERLFDALNLDKSLVDAIVDWQDSDNISNPNGAEVVHYGNLLLPYSPRNAPFITAGELLLVKGFTREEVFLPPSSRGMELEDEFKSLSHYITVYGDGMININTAEIPVLLSLSRDMDDFIARDIVEYRENHPFLNIEDLKNVESVTDVLYDEIASLISVKSNTFRITAEGMSSRIVQKIVAVVLRQNKGFRVVYFTRSL